MSININLTQRRNGGFSPQSFGGFASNPLMQMMQMMMQIMMMLMSGAMGGGMGNPALNGGGGMGGMSPLCNPGFGGGCGGGCQGGGLPGIQNFAGGNGEAPYSGSLFAPNHGMLDGPLPPGPHNTQNSAAFGTQTVGGRNSMKVGTLVLKDPQSGQVMGQYRFRNGGHGRGAIPWGTYEMSNGRRRSDQSFSSGGFGFSFDLTQKGMAHGTARDSRYGTPRTLLRVHPDGGSPGTMGCIGIVGGADVQRDFYQKAMELQQRYGGKFELEFRPG